MGVMNGDTGNAFDVHLKPDGADRLGRLLIEAARRVLDRSELSGISG